MTNSEMYVDKTILIRRYGAYRIFTCEAFNILSHASRVLCRIAIEKCARNLKYRVVLTDISDSTYGRELSDYVYYNALCHEDQDLVESSLLLLLSQENFRVCRNLEKE